MEAKNGTTFFLNNLRGDIMKIEHDLTLTKHPSTWARYYKELGFAPIPVVYGEKLCTIPDWPNLLIEADQIPRYFNEDRLNIGILLGKPSGGLVDIDLDCEEAIALAPFILPETEMIFGRESRPRSHWIYKTLDNPGRREAFTAPDRTGTLLEIRGEGSFTIFPGSVHPSGEQVRFDRDGEPAVLSLDELRASARQLAAACLLLRCWREGQRHDLALAVAGALLSGGVDRNVVTRLIDAVARAAGDNEVQDRFRCVEDTAKQLECGGPVTGRTELATLMGERDADQFCGWLGVRKKIGAVYRSGQAVELTAAFGGPVPHTDLANAERFSARYGHIVRYCHTLRGWFVWDGRHWKLDDDGEIARLAQSTVRDMAIQAADNKDKEGLGWAARSHDFQRLRNMVVVARSQCSVRQKEFDADPWKLNCLSGVIDLKSGELRPHEPALLMRKLAPVAFDRHAECPLFRCFLDRIFDGDQELIAFVQRAAGYSLTGRTSEQCLFLLVGRGANGKSTLIGLFQGLLGDYAQQTPMDSLMTSKAGGIPNDIARLEGARFVAAVEAEAGQRIAEAKVKQLTGSDRIAARYLYGEHFEFISQFKIFLGTNRLPEV
jgi:putative DNA primase/helicase